MLSAPIKMCKWEEGKAGSPSKAPVSTTYRHLLPEQKCTSQAVCY